MFLQSEFSDLNVFLLEAGYHNRGGTDGPATPAMAVPLFRERGVVNSMPAQKIAATTIPLWPAAPAPLLILRRLRRTCCPSARVIPIPEESVREEKNNLLIVSGELVSFMELATLQ